MKGREMKNKRSLLFILCGMLLIPLFSADTQVLAAKKAEAGNEAVVVKDGEPKNEEKSGEKPEETSGEKSDKEPKENQEELTSPIKQDKSAADKAENKEKKKRPYFYITLDYVVSIPMKLYVLLLFQLIEKKIQFLHQY